MKLFSTTEAAAYVGDDVGVIKYHYHISKKLAGQKIGGGLVFDQADLDAFQASRQPSGRPPKQIARVPMKKVGFRISYERLLQVRSERARRMAGGVQRDRPWVVRVAVQGEIHPAYPVAQPVQVRGLLVVVGPTIGIDGSAIRTILV